MNHEGEKNVTRKAVTFYPLETSTYTPHPMAQRGAWVPLEQIRGVSARDAVSLRSLSPAHLLRAHNPNKNFTYAAR